MKKVGFIKKSLSQAGRELGISRQAVWVKTQKGREYLKTEKYLKYQREYKRKHYQPKMTFRKRLIEAGILTFQPK